MSNPGATSSKERALSKERDYSVGEKGFDTREGPYPSSRPASVIDTGVAPSRAVPADTERMAQRV